jgi:NADH-quinone oxidoreductase subunit H
MNMLDPFHTLARPVVLLAHADFGLFDWIQTYIPPWVWIALVVHFAILGTVAYLILLERKVASWTQDRLGPNRVGPWGLLQPLADGLKFILKEDYRPKHVDTVLFTVAPALMIMVVIISIAVLPWGGVKQSVRRLTVPTGTETQMRAAAQRQLFSGATIRDVQEVDHVDPGTDVTGQAVPRQSVVDVTYRWAFQITTLNIGVLYILAVLSLAVYGIVLGGWASNNKYSFLGALRATAQMISYEIPLGLSVLAVVVLYGTLDLNLIVDRQAHTWLGFIPAWNIFTQPLAFFLFLICIHAEANRAPFDLAEAEQELVGGYHTEYSAMRFALFFLAEYAGMITTSVVCVALFFGGWHFPGLSGHIDPTSPSVTDSMLLCIVRGLVVFAKTIAIIFVFMWVRWSLPRFRFDQLMQLAWRALIPIALAVLLVTALVVFFGGDQNLIYRRERRVDGAMAAALFLSNVILLAIIMIVSRVLPPGPDTNRRMDVPHSRFANTPLPAQHAVPEA